MRIDDSMDPTGKFAAAMDSRDWRRPGTSGAELEISVSLDTGLCSSRRPLNPKIRMVMGKASATASTPKI